MATVTIKKHWFDRACGKKQAVETLKERLPLLGIALEQCTEEEVTVEVFPNRPDFFAGPLLARAYAQFQGISPGLKKVGAKPSPYVVMVESPVAGVRPYTACAVVKGLRFTDDLLKEIIQVQEKLHTTVCRNRKKAAIGIYPMEKITWPVVYTAEKPENIRFAPLESKEMSANAILETHPAGRAYSHLLADAKVYPLFKDASGAVLSMPPIINADKTGKVTLDTRDVFIECSGFDQEFLNSMLCILVAMLEEVGGSVHEVTLQYKQKIVVTPNLEPRAMKLDVSYINKRLGTAHTKDTIKDALERMGHTLEKDTLFSPRWRTDILHQVDLAEDAAIAIGYDQLEPDMSLAPSIAQENPQLEFQSKIAGVLAGLGMLEACTYHLSSSKAQGEMMLSTERGIPLTNALTIDYAVLRAWLLPSLTEVLATNTSQEYPQLFFTMGNIFVEDKKQETGIREESRLSLVISHATATLTEIRQVVERLLSLLQLKFSIKNGVHPSCIEGRVGEISVNNKKIGWFGELHPQVLDNWNLHLPVVAGEINLEELFSLVLL